METIVTPRPGPAKLIAGLFFTMLGVVLTLDNLDLFDADRILRYWPLFLVLLGAIYLADAARPRHRLHRVRRAAAPAARCPPDDLLALASDPHRRRRDDRPERTRRPALRHRRRHDGQRVDHTQIESVAR